MPTLVWLPSRSSKRTKRGMMRCVTINSYNKIAWISVKEMSAAAGVVVDMNSGFRSFFETRRKNNGLHKNFADVAPI